MTTRACFQLETPDATLATAEVRLGRHRSTAGDAGPVPQAEEPHAV